MGTAVNSPTPTPVPGSPTATFGFQPCPGDCDGDGMVTIDELVTAVNIALGSAGVAACPAADHDQSGAVTIDELVRAVNAALSGCPLEPTRNEPTTHSPRAYEHCNHPSARPDDDPNDYSA